MVYTYDIYMNDEYLDSLISLLVNIGAEEYTVIANVSHVFGGGGGIYSGAIILGWSAIEELYTSVAIIYTKFILLCLLRAASFSVLRTRAAAFP